MTRSSAASPVLGRLDESVDEGKGEEEAEGEEDMSNLCDGSDLDSDTAGGGAEEEEEEVMEVEEDGEEAEEEEEADGGDEGTEEVEDAEEEEEADGGDEGTEEVEDAEEEEEADGGDEGTEQVEGAEEAATVVASEENEGSEEVEEAEEAATAVAREEENEGSEEEEQGEGGSGADSPAESPAKVEEGVDDESLLEKRTCTGILNVKKEHDILGDRQPPSAIDSVDTVKEALLLKEEELVEVPNKRGWCVKGSSCRFLHQKDMDVATQTAKENLTGTSSQIDLKEDTGQHEVDRFYTPRKSLILSDENSASKSLQRALVRAYGGHELPKFEDKDSQSLFQTDSSLGTKTWNAGVQLTAADSGLFPDRHRITYAEGAGIPRSGWPSFQLSGFPQTSLIQAEDVKSYDTSFSRKKLDSHFNCIDGGSTMVGGFISRKYLGEGKVHQELSTKEYADDGSFSRGSPMMKNGFTTEYKYCSSNSLMHSSVSLSTSSPNANDRSITDSVSLHGPNTSYGSKGLFNSSFQDSSSHALHSSNSLQQNAVHSTFGSMPLGSDDVGTSSPANQYDPLSDSIEPSRSLPSQHKSIDDLPKGSHSPGDNDLKLNISFRKSHEPIVSKSTIEHRTGVYSSSGAGVSGLGTLDGVNRSSIVKEKSWSPVHVTDVQNMKENDYEDGPRTREEKSRQQKETRALKTFRACLVEFVKDLVKPAWREGHLSKDAHKMVVKKAAEKVVSALQGHQIPTTMDAINQYLSASRSKIVKLVERPSLEIGGPHSSRKIAKLDQHFEVDIMQEGSPPRRCAV
ncbi:hypothetical protein Taro_025588 [Colocasia esculenta]|uniref:C3H1-type domain-containing protein n=1 Tax=Colocasia esculenta TaxID=4460 RepID=A0A843VKY3_COLES|nr:hypothetical protein [Colocasia esculenta]